MFTEKFFVVILECYAVAPKKHKIKEGSVVTTNLRLMVNSGLIPENFFVEKISRKRQTFGIIAAKREFSYAIRKRETQR